MKSKPKTKEQSRKITPIDVRMARPIIVRDLTTKSDITMQAIDTIEVDGCEISFQTPNTVSIFASIAKKELQQARNIYSSVISKQIKGKKLLDIDEKDIPRLYNYLENIQSSIIAVYTAIESFANVAIPAEYTHSLKNNKGIQETWDKAAIERWQKTSDKVSIFLPEIFNCESPKNLPEWSQFKALESIRNDIIHQKTLAPSEGNKVDSNFMKKLFNPDIFKIVESGFVLIKFFCEKNTSHSYFPLGFGEALIEPLEMDDAMQHFTLVRSANKSS